MDLIPDDEALNTKGKTVMKWDKVKKRYMLQKVDREGRVMKEKRNESGKKISKKKDIDNTAIYKKWQKTTMQSLQRTGEMEDKKIVNNAKNSIQDRKNFKDFQNRHGDELKRGEDMRSNKSLIESKKKRMIDKLRQSGMKKGQDKSGIKDKLTGGKHIKEKAHNKIVKRSLPTRSRVITKTGSGPRNVGGRGKGGKRR